MRHRYSKFLPGFTLMCDLLCFNAAYLFASQVVPFNINGSNVVFIILANLGWLAIAPFSTTYLTPRPLLLQYSLEKFMEVVLFHSALVSFLVYFSSSLGMQINISGLFLSYGLFIASVCIHRYVLSLTLSYIRKKGYNLRNIIILGETETAERLREHFTIHPEYGYDLIHNVLDRDISAYGEDELASVLLDKSPDEIFICYKNIDQRVVDFMVRFGAEHNVNVKMVSDLILKKSYARVVNYDNLPVLHLRHEPSLSLRIAVAKRCFDIAFSAAVIVASSPILLMLYLITKATSKGPAFYRQERIGLNGKPFEIIKFRSMYIDAEQAGPQLAKHGDPRVTPWGRIIRKTRLDELPQFWNVLKGDMSVVGPRPERSHYIEQISAIKPQYRLLQAIKPGITSIGQVNYGYAENVDQMCERMQYDLLYLHNISFTADIRLIVNTVKVMVQGSGK